jgi:hypothetical protein
MAIERAHGPVMNPWLWHHDRPQMLISTHNRVAPQSPSNMLVSQMTGVIRKFPGRSTPMSVYAQESMLANNGQGLGSVVEAIELHRPGWIHISSF